VLGICIPAGSTVALLDFPSYQNVGDPAIWLGTVAELRRLECRIAYVCDQSSYSRAALDRRLPAGAPILLQGGGSFGDLWPEHQLFRERVIADFPDRPIIQLPVSIEFRDPESEERARGALNRHEQLTLLCRDRPSRDYASGRYDARVLLCPDAALGLEPPSRAWPGSGVVMLVRSDHERLTELPPIEGARVLDWSSAPGEPGYSAFWEWQWRTTRRLGRIAARGAGADRLVQTVLGRLFDSMARRRLAFGYEVIGSARVLVTDRLHGHILALLMGVPHVVVESGYGKVRAFCEAFSGGLDGVTFCDEPERLGPLVERLLER
jgi:exopolysaccharide biosynthesis predicted pyruvyltransferase EpsI